MNMISDVKVSLNVRSNQYWADRDNFKLPKNELGNNVNLSTYERTSWFIVGLDLLLQNPQGYGLLHAWRYT